MERVAAFVYLITHTLSHYTTATIEESTTIRGQSNTIRGGAVLHADKLADFPPAPQPSNCANKREGRCVNTQHKTVEIHDPIALLPQVGTEDVHVFDSEVEG